jgi:hypothetical protein
MSFAATVEVVSWLTEPDSDWDASGGPGRQETNEPRSKLRLIALLLGGWLAVSLVVLLVLLAVSGRHPSQRTAEPGASSPATPRPSHPAGSALPAGWVERASDDQRNCAAHSYGQVASFFASTPCTSVHRELATTSQGGRSIVIAASTVRFASATQAQRYIELVNADGTGNISDLLREGARYNGGPTALPDAAFASRQNGTLVLVAEAGYAGGASDPTDPTLRSVVDQAVS